MVVKIDVDGVIRDIFTKMCKVYNEIFGLELTPMDIFDYDVEKVFPKIRETLHMDASYFFFEKLSKDIFFKSKPYNGVKESIQELMDAGHKVVIVTWQKTDESKINTINFLKKYNIPYDDICFTRDKWMINGDWLIDDNPEFILDKKDLSNKIMINMPFNVNTEFSGIRVNNLSEAINLILKKDVRFREKVFTFRYNDCSKCDF